MMMLLQLKRVKEIEASKYLKEGADGRAIKVWNKAMNKVEYRLSYLLYCANSSTRNKDDEMSKFLNTIDNISAKYECSTVKSVNYVAGAFIWVGDRFTKTGNKIAALSVKIPDTCKLIKEKFTNK